MTASVIKGSNMKIFAYKDRRRGDWQLFSLLDCFTSDCMIVLVSFFVRKWTFTEGVVGCLCDRMAGAEFDETSRSTSASCGEIT